MLGRNLVMSNSSAGLWGCEGDGSAVSGLSLWWTSSMDRSEQTRYGAQSAKVIFGSSVALLPPSTAVAALEKTESQLVGDGALAAGCVQLHFFVELRRREAADWRRHLDTGLYLSLSKTGAESLGSNVPRISWDGAGSRRSGGGSEDTE